MHKLDLCDYPQFCLLAGIIYTLNLILAFQWGAVFEFDHQEHEELDGPTVAICYLK